jgi:hypothetical protein
MSQAVGSGSKRKAISNRKNRGGKSAGSSSSEDTAIRIKKARTLALKVVKEDLSKGSKIVDWKDIQGILAAFVEDFLPSDPFDVLTTEDLFQIYIDTHNSSSAITVNDVQPSSGQASIKHGQATPESNLSEHDLPLVDDNKDDGPMEPMDGVG